MSFLPAELIKKKRAGLEHTPAELEFLIGAFARGELPDYQMSAWLMAVFFKGMTAAETANLTHSMMTSGEVLKFPDSLGVTVDKHSTGGVGDKASLILAPIAAAAGVPVPMIAGRGLGHTGGTLDKLEAIPGFRVGLSLDEFRKQIADIGIAMIGQTSEICPADRKMYALRDVTGTVESLPLICGSIMSKKLAEGIQALVLDVKVGSGAFMKTLDDAERLANSLMSIGRANGREVVSFITDMSQPLGRFAGNACETEECLAILQQKDYRGFKWTDFNDTTELSLELAAAMIWLGKKAKDLEGARRLAEEILRSGRAYEKFVQICKAQGGDLSQIPKPQCEVEIKSTTAGFVEAFATESIGVVGLNIGAGRTKAADSIDPTAGIAFHKKIGDRVEIGETIFSVFGNDLNKIQTAQRDLLAAIKISLQKPALPSLIVKRLL